MKSLYNYICETGHYEEFTDEDIGEVSKMWIEDPTPDELAKREMAREEDANDYYEKCKKERKYSEKLHIDELEDLVWNLQNELRDLHEEYKQLQIDQEEEVGELYANGDEASAERLAQTYGNKFNKNIKKQESLKAKLKTARRKLDDANNKLITFCKKLWSD